MSRSITSTTAKVCENARTHSPPLHAASSPFATLLRRSRFASFDPLIRQTYFAPDSHANRGDYGTKRPLPVRRRNSFVTIASYDEHHNYTEWTRGESQVRFLRRFEELNVAAKPPEDRGWGTLLGRTLRDAWLVDSEFGHPQTEASSGLTPEPIIGLRLRPDASLPTTTPATLDFPKGRSGYGSRAKPEPVSIVSSNLVQPTAAPFAYDELPASKRFLVPNLEAMSTRRRRVYLRKLRSLRPQFAKFLEDKEQKQRVVDSQAKLDEEKRIIEANRQAQAELTSGATSTKPMIPPAVRAQPKVDSDNTDTPTLLRRAQHSSNSFEDQKAFLHDQAQRMFNSDTYFKERDGRPVIMPLPHPVAGLTYSHPSPLQTAIGTRYEVSRHYPGYILHPSVALQRESDEVNPERESGKPSHYTFVTAVGGFSSRLRTTPGEVHDKRALYNPFKSQTEGGGISPDPAHIDEAVGEFTLHLQPPGSLGAHVLMSRAPAVVERYHNRATNPAGLNGALVRTEFRMRRSTSYLADNPYWPGGRLYNVGNPTLPDRAPTSHNRTADRNLSAGAIPADGRNRNLFAKQNKAIRRTPSKFESRDVVVDRLSRMLPPKKDL